MKLSVVTTTPEVQAPVPVALLRGTFAERLERAVQLGYDGVELMAQRPADLDEAVISRPYRTADWRSPRSPAARIPFLDRLTLLSG